MGTWLFYIFKSTICLTVLYFLFRMFFRTDTLFRTNRLLLLVGTLCCMLLPFVQIDIVESRLWQQPFATVKSVLVSEQELSVAENIETDETAQVPVMSVSGDGVTGVGVSRLSRLPFYFSWSATLGILYLIGAGSTFLFFLLSIWRMLRLVRRCPMLDCGKYKLVISQEKISSFSWGSVIVLSREDYDRHVDEVLLHEQMHLHYHHTSDLLWMEALIVLHWFNPAVWLLMRDMRELHEYEADNGVLTHGIDATQYQLLLVKKSVGTRLYSMANGFNHSKLKNRINMMLKKRTNNWARLKLLLFVPVAAGTLMAFAQPEVKEAVTLVVKPESTVTETGLQDSICCGGWGLLEQYFKRKTEEAYPGKKADSWGEESLWQFFINMNNQLMLGNEKLQDVEQLRVQWADILRKGYREAVEKNDRLKLPKLRICYDRGATMFTVRSSLQALKEAYEQIHGEISAQIGNATEGSPDSLLPIAVYMATPPIYKNLAKYRTPANVPLPIEVSFFSSGKQLSEKLKDITLDELRQVVKRYKKEVRDNGLEICLEVDKNAKMAVMNDARQVIREAYSSN